MSFDDNGATMSDHVSQASNHLLATSVLNRSEENRPERKL